MRHHRWLVACAGTLALGLVQCYNPDDYEPGRNTNDVLTLAPLDTSALADGQSQTAFRANIPADAQAGSRQVVFSTSGATIAEATGSPATVDTVVVDSTGAATIHVVSPLDSGAATVHAVAGGVTRVATISFLPSLPDTILLEPQPFAVVDTATSQVTITAMLRRVHAGGRVTSGRVVTFTATAVGGGDPGTLGLATLSDSTGTVTIPYAPDSATAPGVITITAKTAGATPSDTAVGVTNIRLLTP